jgi:hypothetical protein
MAVDRPPARTRSWGWVLVLILAVPSGCSRIQPADALNGAEKGDHMQEKLDPRLLALVESAGTDAEASAGTVDVLVGLDLPLDASTRNDLTSRGLTLRSDVGTVLTGSIKIGDVARLARSERVVKVEASAPLYREGGDREANRE